MIFRRTGRIALIAVVAVVVALTITASELAALIGACSTKRAVEKLLLLLANAMRR